ncbi:UDP-2,4-diacetamido-2,4,6-trideoxy-beta-L-altropyranose hydrolase [Sporosarcina cyprini]|uniref:UDP-2,4-diacetamido-2,4, 6-trideoxy-beta-L-altropyranose hydrolase n=1 Tax=Sporosarcina cyprini TaxID=2910523 RepID=UPI001EDE3C6B|nr:UDP-2,4-diacetamido-2,4,6-trideoxy-beta-L-altropyranose hydrolase [Sporosarcina cyprini]MCG3089603.1 UDP-2,4-diacetamido-2,4,6-trideoxy-beta-L-altropyranose hydrolase [Sporosarcina cyprini]
MNIVIRADASIEIGTGHIMRCLTLAKQLKRHGTEVTFICRELEGNMIDFLKKETIKVVSLPNVSKKNDNYSWMINNWEVDAKQTREALKGKPIDLLIVDHYAFDKKWEEKTRDISKKIMVIDDLADRSHDCDLLLDQNYYINKEKRYKNLIPDQAITLLGPNYALLRDEFIEAAKSAKVRSGKVNRILVFFGGSDPTRETIKTLLAIQEFNDKNLEIDVVVGASNPFKKIIENLCNQIPKATYYCQINSIAELMNNADLSIGAGGTTLWERAYLGLPSIVIAVAENQYNVSRDLSKLGAIKFLGKSKYTNIDSIRRTIKNVLENPEYVKKLSINSRCLVDDYVNRKVVLAIEELLYAN